MYAQPTDKTAVIGSFTGVVTARTGINGWYRTAFREAILGGFVPDVHLTEPGEGSVSPVQLASRLKIELKRDGIPLSLDGPEHTAVGVAYGEDAMKDIRIYANDRKIYYGAADSAEARERLRFTTSLQLKRSLE